MAIIIGYIVKRFFRIKQRYSIYIGINHFLNVEVIVLWVELILHLRFYYNSLFIAKKRFYGRSFTILI